jgi:hypothetical protein
MLSRYWFCTDRGIGYGVTAFSQADAEALLAAHGYPHGDQKVHQVIVNIAIESLNQGHVIPNMGPVVIRGVWFPRHNV